MTELDRTKDNPIFTPTFRTLQVLQPVAENVIAVHYRADHPTLTLALNGDPSEVDVRLPGGLNPESSGCGAGFGRLEEPVDRDRTGGGGEVEGQTLDLSGAEISSRHEFDSSISRAATTGVQRIDSARPSHLEGNREVAARRDIDALAFASDEASDREEDIPGGVDVDRADGGLS